MTAIVVDSSVALKWFVPEEHSDRAARLLDDRYELLAPDLIVPEFGNVLWKKARRGEVAGDEVKEILAAFRAVPIEIVASSDVIELAVDIAIAHGRTVYDASYVAVAAARNCILITADERLVRSLAKSRLGERVQALSTFAPEGE